LSISFPLGHFLFKESLSNLFHVTGEGGGKQRAGHSYATACAWMILRNLH
jgi:hypothetical protein